MAIFTAFGGGIDMDIPELNWQRVGASHFGLSGDGVIIHQNGVTTMAISFSQYYDADRYWISVFNPASKEWEATGERIDRNYGIFFGGYGLFLAHQYSSSPTQNTPYDYRSVDGIHWTLFGYNSWGSSALATNGETAVATIWHSGNPYAYSPDVHSARVLEICSIPDAFSQTIICNRSMYVMENAHNNSLYCSFDGGQTFTKTLAFPHGCDESTYVKGVYPNCVCREKVFITTYERSTKEDQLINTLGQLNQDGTDYTEIASIVSDSKYTTIKTSSVIYIESIGKYMAFYGTIYTSPDCIHWTERSDLVPTTSEEFLFAWYVKGKGIYCRSGNPPNMKLYFAPLP